MQTVEPFPTIPCPLRSENVHQEAIGPGFDTQHLHKNCPSPIWTGAIFIHELGELAI